MQRLPNRLAVQLRLQAQQDGVRLELVQLDYLLTWLLAGISTDPILGRDLVFKGGTALKKCYFGDYRFSEDLDFTARPGAISGEKLMSCVDSLVRHTEELMNQHAPISLVWNRHEERDPHPDGQEAFRARARFPGQREHLVSAMIEISFSEEIVFAPEKRPIIHAYFDSLAYKIQVYPLEEVCLEKLRGILQHTKKLHERGWTRSRTRDYYDLYRLFLARPDLIDSDALVAALQRKCVAKGVTFSSTDDFFDPLFMRAVHRDWRQHLGYLVRDLPPLEQVIQELLHGIKKLLQSPHEAYQN